MTDLSKIDFTRLTLPEWSGDRVVCRWSRTAGSLLVKRNGSDFASLSPGRPWVYDRGSWVLLEVAKTYTDRVDAFIAEESARLAKEDEADWVPVPWQDALWLRENGCKVIVERGPGYECLKNVITVYDSGLAAPSSGPFLEYRADCRTFPADYDPTKPRWVDIDWRQVKRLEDSGAHVQVKGGFAVENGVATVVFCDRYSGDAGTDGHDREKYRVDIHTLKPGVPLHLEAPELEPRPCTREFALTNPDESAWRVRQYDGDRFSWSTWQPMSRVPLFQASVDDYEFRTTAREPELVIGRSGGYEFGIVPIPRDALGNVDISLVDVPKDEDEYRAMSELELNLADRRHAYDRLSNDDVEPCYVAKLEPEKRRVTVEFDGKRWAGELTEC